MAEAIIKRSFDTWSVGKVNMTFIKGNPVSLILGVLSGCKNRKRIKWIQRSPTLLYISTGVHPKNYLRKYTATVPKKRFFYRLKDKIRLS